MSEIPETQNMMSEKGLSHMSSPLIHAQEELKTITKRSVLLHGPMISSPESGEAQQQLIGFQETATKYCAKELDKDASRLRLLLGLEGRGLHLSPTITIGSAQNAYELFLLNDLGEPNLRKIAGNVLNRFSLRVQKDGKVVNGVRSALQEENIRPGQGHALKLLYEMYTLFGVQPSPELLEQAGVLDGNIFDAGEYTDVRGEKTNLHDYYVIIPGLDGKPLGITRFFVENEGEVKNLLEDEPSYQNIITQLIMLEEKTYDEKSVFDIANAGRNFKEGRSLDTAYSWMYDLQGLRRHPSIYANVVAKSPVTLQAIKKDISEESPVMSLPIVSSALLPQII